MKIWFAGCLCFASAVSIAAEGDNPLAANFGFQPLDVIKVTERANNLLAGDMNHDGLLDLVITDNSQHRINLWIQRGGTKKTAKPQAKGRVNELDEATRYELVKLGADQEIAAVALGDFDGDGRTDVAHFGLPDKLIIRYQPAEGEWKKKKQIRIPDVAAAPWCLAAGDLDQNGLDDLVVLGKSETLILSQKTQGTLDPPVKLLNTSEQLGLVQIADLDGDGRHDLCYLAGDGLGRVLACRLQSKEGRLGPEYVFDLERPRAVTLRDVDGKPGHEILTIDSRTGRLKMFQVRSREIQKGELPERLIAYGFGKTGSGKERDWAFGDFDGDKKIDLVVSDPTASRMILYRQQEQGGLDLGTPFPSLAGIEALYAADFDGDGKSELVIHSPSEKAIGLSKYADGRLSFPEILASGEDVAKLEVADYDGKPGPELLLLFKSKKGKDAEYQLRASSIINGQLSEVKFGDKTSAALALKGTPERLRAVDLTGDGLPDFVVHQGTSKPPQTFLQRADGSLNEAVGSALNLPAAAASAVSVWIRPEQRGLLVAQENFARWLTLSLEKGWQVSDQFNIVESNAAIAGALPIHLDDDETSELAIVDSGVKKLRLWKKQEAVYGPWKEIDLVNVTFKGMEATDLNGDGKDDLAVLSAEKVLVLYSGGSAPVIQETATFESQLEKVYPTDVVAGDLNGDGKVDLALTDVRNHYIELLDYDATEGIRHALYFRLFEHKSFARDDTPDTEPREALIADVTGDKRADLVLLVHDRILIYPQDDGAADKK